MEVIALLILIFICTVALCDRSIRKDKFAKTFVSVVLVVSLAASFVFIIIH